MLDAIGLYNKVTEKMENVISGKKNYPTSAVDSLTRLSNAIGEYIEENASITYGWSGVYTPPSGSPVSDLVVSFNASVSYNSSVMSPPSSIASFTTGLSSFLKTAFTISPPSDFSLAPLTFNPLGLIVIAPAGETTYESSMSNMCSQIITQFKTAYINPAPSGGTHLPTGPTPFVGSTVSMIIS